MSSQPNTPRDTQPHSVHPPSLQRQDATARAPTILEEISAEVEAARWAALPHQYLSVLEANDPDGNRARELAFYNAVAGDNDSLFESIFNHIIEEILSDSVSFQWYLNNPPPPYTTHPTKGEITVEMSPEVVLPAYLPPYSPFRQEREDINDKEEEGEVMEQDNGENRERFPVEVAAANPVPAIPFLGGRRIPLRLVYDFLQVLMTLVLGLLLLPRRIDALALTGFLTFLHLMDFLYPSEAT